MIYEAGVIGARPQRLPLSIGDPTLVSGATAVCSMYDIFTLYLQRGNVDVGFLGGAQIDRYGNINSTVIGDYIHPKVRLPGSGGSMEMAAWANRCYIITPTKNAAFQNGSISAPLLVSCRGALNGTPPVYVALDLRQSFTDLGILEPDENGEMILTALHPGISAAQAQANTGWLLKWLPTFQPPTHPSNSNCASCARNWTRANLPSRTKYP